MYFLAYVSNIYIPLTLNDADMKGGSAVRHPHSPELHPAPVPARVLLRQVAHAHGEHVLSGVICDRRPSLPVRGWIRVIGAREARAELPHPALTPVLHVTDVLRVIVTRDSDGPTLQHRHISYSADCAETPWKILNTSICTLV